MDLFLIVLCARISQNYKANKYVFHSLFFMIPAIPIQKEPDWLLNYKPGQELPLQGILRDSFYYPACGLDFNAIMHFAHYTQSFIYVDHSVEPEELKLKLEQADGYRLFSLQSPEASHLCPGGSRVDLSGIDMEEYYRYANTWKPPFRLWAVLEKVKEFPENLGPERISLLFICGEGLATFQELYYSNKTSPMFLALIQPGCGYSNNWSDFVNERLPFAQTVLNNPYGQPEYIVWGGYIEDYDARIWRDYPEKIHRIRPYYFPEDREPHGEAGVWKGYEGLKG